MVDAQAGGEGVAVDPIDLRIDPTQRENKAAFWHGYGRYREGVNYTDLPKGADYLAGWCYGLTEGRRKGLPKPWWQSRTTWVGVAMGLASILSTVDPSMITDNPRAVSALAAVVAAAVIVLRRVTKGPIQ